MNQQQPPRYEVPATVRTGIAAQAFLLHFAKTMLAVMVLLGFLVLIALIPFLLQR